MKTETTSHVEFETMKEFFTAQATCPDRCEEPKLRIESKDSGTRHMRCGCCGCEWLEHLS